MAPRIYAGRFDPRFLGVSIPTTSPLDLHSYRFHDSSTWAPADALAELSDDAVVSDLSRQTVLDHELRHFRDSLLFPFGAAVTRSRIHASYNGFQAAMAVKRASGADTNTLPIPLQRWLRMPPEARTEFRAGKTGPDGKALRVPQLPVISAEDDVSVFAAGLHSFDRDEALITGCRITLADYRMIDRLWRSPHAEGEEVVLQALDLWEAAAMLCQLAVIEQHVGSALMQRFLGWVVHHGPPVYRRGLIGLTACLHRMEWPLTLRNHLALVTWTQMGAYETETSQSSPGIRLTTLASAASLGSRWSEGSAFADLVKDWDAVVGADSFGALHAANERFAAFCRRSASLPSLPAEMFTSLAAAREQMSAAFNADPDAYVTPADYLADKTRYPLPCVGLDYPSDTLARTGKTPRRWTGRPW
jgi:hypothetical protein